MLVANTGIGAQSHIRPVEDSKELHRLDAGICDLIGLAAEAAKKLEALADNLGFHEPPEPGNTLGAAAPLPAGIVYRLHDSVQEARREVSRIHRVFDRLNRLA